MCLKLQNIKHKIAADAPYTLYATNQNRTELQESTTTKRIKKTNWATIKKILEEGIRIRKQRCIEPEAVFGQLKSNNRFQRFTFFGKKMAEMELCLMAMGHNLRKLQANISQKHNKIKNAA